MLRLYDTLTREIKPFVPMREDKVVSMYSCGPTVYFYAHIGNMRAYLFMDLLRRVLKYNNYKIDGVINITDVGHLTSDADEGEDKMEVASRRENKTPWEIAEYYTNFFMKQSALLNIDMPEKVVKATNKITEMINMVQDLVKNGYAYETSKGVYYDVQKYGDYGKLSGSSLDGKKAGARVEIDPEKKHPADFALWVKAPKEHIMQWDSPWGRGYPGWHIECSAIGIDELGNSIDIHTGGIDHIPVHHENEIAQNYGVCGHKVVQNWMHVEFLQVDGGKMSKSLGNIYTIDDLIDKGYRALDFKYFTLNAHYSNPLNFTFEALTGAKTALTRLYELAIEHKNGSNRLTDERIDFYKTEFLKAINNNLNAPLALSVVWKMLRENNQNIDVYNLLIDFDSVLGLDIENAEHDSIILAQQQKNNSEIPNEVLELAEKRMQEKASKNWEQSDKLRDEILALGFVVADTPQGYEIKPL